MILAVLIVLLSALGEGQDALITGIDGNLYCTVEILNKDTGEWIAKQDVGTTGYTEKEKSKASDSFKRACFNWGIGRELYSAPFIRIPSGKAIIQMKEDTDRKKRYYCNDRFSVSSIGYNAAREMDSLVVVNEKGQEVYTMTQKDNPGTARSKEKNTDKSGDEKKTGQKNPITKEQMESLQAELERTGVTMEAVQDRYQIKEPWNMSGELYNKVMSALKRTKPKEAE